MGYVANLIFCETAQQIPIGDNKNKTNAIGILSRGTVLSIPSFFSLTVITLFNENTDHPIEKIKLIVKDPSGKELIAPDELVKKDIDGMVGENKDKRDLTLCLNIQNLIIDSTGKYVFEVFVNDLLDYSASLLIDIKEQLK